MTTEMKSEAPTVVTCIGLGIMQQMQWADGQNVQVPSMTWRGRELPQIGEVFELHLSAWRPLEEREALGTARVVEVGDLYVTLEAVEVFEGASC